MLYQSLYWYHSELAWWEERTHWERPRCWERLTVLVAQLCLTLCDPMDGSPPGSSVHGISQARKLEWVAISFSRERLKAGGEGDNRGWNGWMASPTRWTWVWVDSGSWWWTGKTDMLQSMGSKESDTTECLNWTWMYIKRKKVAKLHRTLGYLKPRSGQYQLGSLKQIIHFSYIQSPHLYNSDHIMPLLGCYVISVRCSFASICISV